MNAFVQGLGLGAAIVCVVAYAVGERWFNIANMVAWPLVGLSALVAGAWGSLLLTASFGIIGTWKFWQERKHQFTARDARRAMIRSQANKVLMDAADGKVLYYREGER